jgi:hypothetical protein
MTDFDALSRKWRADRNSLKRELVTIEEALSTFKVNPDRRSSKVVKLQLDQFAVAVAEFRGVCFDCIKYYNGKEKDPDVIESEFLLDYEGFRNRMPYLQGEYSITALQINEKSNSSEASNAARTARLATGLKMPDFVVPEFNGNLREYHDWAAQFENLVHNNEALNAMEKLHCLKSSLKGDAAEILRDTLVTAEAYEDAYNEVKLNYDNKRCIIAAHFSDLVELKPIRSESEIRDALRKVSAALRGINACGINADSLSPLVAYLVSTKLETSLRRDWERSITNNSTYPTFKSLEEYLRVISFAFESSQPLKNSELKSENLSFRSEKMHVKKERKAMFASSKTTSENCPMCSGSHSLSSCGRFLAMSQTDRYGTVKKLRLCTNCFDRSHKVNECVASKCLKCKKPHHTTLHREDLRPPPEERRREKMRCDEIS